MESIVVTRVDGDARFLCRVCGRNPRNWSSGLCATCISDEAVAVEEKEQEGNLFEL